MLRVAVELASTAQRDLFVEKPNDLLKEASKLLSDCCELAVQAIDDPDFIQPRSLDIVNLRKRSDELDFGIMTQQDVMGALTVAKVAFSSSAHRSGRIFKGDELVQVNHQTVVGWPPATLQHLLAKCGNEVIITIKKRPIQSLNSGILITKPYVLPEKLIVE